jgi:heme-degrading monooxygenase HmoA
MSEAFVYIWQFDVEEARRVEFERHYGPSGSWAALFRRARGYLGTQLLKDQSMPGRYLTVDRWQSAAAYRAFREEFAAAYAELDQQFEKLTREERAIGDYTEVAS